MKRPKIFIHCQYVYGLGHLIRSLQLAKGLVNNFEVYFFNGGEHVKGITIPESIYFIQLDALYKEEDNNFLSSVDESLTVDECLLNRGRVIEELVERICPDIIITEHFPFGFLFENEVMNLISKAKLVNSNVRIVCSVRDIIESRKGSDSDCKTVDLLNENYDLILIHGDKNLIPLQVSFPLLDDVKIRKVRTGYIVDSNLKKSIDKKKTIVVSVAGGRVGEELKNASINAFLRIQNQIEHDIFIFDGAFNSKDSLSISNSRIKYLEFNRELFLKELSKSDLSISLGGYNTTVESLYAANKVLIYNREFLGDNYEQNIRISALSDLGHIVKLNFNDLACQCFSDKIKEVLYSKDISSQISIDFSGVTTSVKEIKRLINV